jgi:hypothetical protein
MPSRRRTSPATASAPVIARRRAAAEPVIGIAGFAGWLSSRRIRATRIGERTNGLPLQGKVAHVAIDDLHSGAVLVEIAARGRRSAADCADVTDGAAVTE